VPRRKRHFAPGEQSARLPDCGLPIPFVLSLSKDCRFSLQISVLALAADSAVRPWSDGR
jgi:hypothetical protein